jgi:DNA repair exonuclease SbcCD ATPase subunit
MMHPKMALDHLWSNYVVAQKLLKRDKAALAAAMERLANVVEARAWLAEVANGIQADLDAALSALVSRCLASIFDNAYRFVIRRVRNGRAASVHMLLVNERGTELDPLAATGGGVVDVTAFALRLSVLLLTAPPVRRVLILDEPFKFVSVEYRERVRALLEELAAELGVQFVLVTHIAELKIGKVINIETATPEPSRPFEVIVKYGTAPLQYTPKKETKNESK